MRSLCLILGVVAASAQEKAADRATYTYDINGRRVLESQRSTASNGSGSSALESVRTLNGRVAPLQKVEERVVSDGPEGKVVERIIRRYEGSGGSATSEKIVVETRKNADGSTTTRTSSFQTDVNGRFELRERSTEQTTRQGGTERAEAVLERPSINGGLETLEKRASVSQGPETDRRRDVTVYRKDNNGAYGVARREIEQVKIANGETTTTSAIYDPNSTGQMQLSGQRVSTVRKAADGSEVEVVDVYGNSQPGRASAGGPALREQQVIERKNSGGQTVETLSIRRPQLDSGQLGPLTRVAETVCTGECKKN